MELQIPVTCGICYARSTEARAKGWLIDDQGECCSNPRCKSEYDEAEAMATNSLLSNEREYTRYEIAAQKGDWAYREARDER